MTAMQAKHIAYTISNKTLIQLDSTIISNRNASHLRFNQHKKYEIWRTFEHGNFTLPTMTLTDTQLTHFKLNYDIYNILRFQNQIKQETNKIESVSQLQNICAGVQTEILNLCI